MMNAVLFMAMSSYFLCRTIYLQAGLGWSVLRARLAAVSFALTTTVFAGVGSLFVSMVDAHASRVASRVPAGHGGVPGSPHRAEARGGSGRA
jgi:hypothetical protein